MLIKPFKTLYNDGAEDAVGKKCVSSALRAAGSIPTRNKYLYCLQILVAGLIDHVHVMFCKLYPH